MIRLCSSLLLFALTVAAAAQHLTLVAKPLTPVEERYVAFFQQGLGDRHVPSSVSAAPSVQQNAIICGTNGQMQTLLTSAQYRVWQQAQHAHGEEDYAVTPVPGSSHGMATVLSANSSRGELFAMGWLLRKLEVTNGQPGLPKFQAFTSAPDRPVRGYQLGYRMKNNTYDSWTLAQFQQQMLDLAVFGLNTMQVISPVSDDDPVSPLFHASALDTVVGLSRLSKEYGLRYDLFYPEMAKDYKDPKQVEAELVQFEALVRKLPLLNSIHVPGGDPGNTAPEVLFPLLEQEAAILHRYHPRATVWVSAQGFTAERYQRFYALMATRPRYIDGIFFGPQSRESMEQQRARLPRQYPVEFYPDTAHTMHSQFPVPSWDPVYQLTEGREPICPRPAQFEHIYKHYAPLNSGFILYSEGVNDDVNKVLWGGWGWDLKQPADSTLRDYARYFFHADQVQAETIAHGIADLEKNWSGPILQNAGIPKTLSLFEMTHPASVDGNWRWDSLLYRATYDRYLQLKRRRELNLEQAAIAVLSSSHGELQQQIADASEVLNHETRSAEEQRCRNNLGQLAGALFHETGLQLSVKLYGASNWERGANYDRADTPLNDRVWMQAQLHRALAAEAPGQAEIVRTVTHWADPVEGTLYDNLGEPDAEPHLQRGEGWAADPELYHTAIDGIADTTLEAGWRFSWLSYAETLYEQPLILRYTHLQAPSAYRVRITYAGEGYHLPMQLRANGLLLQSAHSRSSNPETVEYAIPVRALRGGTLELRWTRAFGAGGSGRGGQVAEVWLIPQKMPREAKVP